MRRMKPIMLKIGFVLFTYNHEKFISESLFSALNQDYPSLDIIIKDDCSSDHTNEIINDILTSYEGRHCLHYDQGKENRGKVARLNEVFSMNKFDLLILADGDDISHTSRASKIVGAWVSRGTPPMTLLHSGRTILADEERDIDGLEQLPREGSRVTLEDYLSCPRALVFGSTIACTTDLYNRFGPLEESTYIEDLQLTFRALLLGQVVAVEDYLVDYRVHANNISAELSLIDRIRWIKYIEKFQLVLLKNLSDLHKAGLEDVSFRLVDQHIRLKIESFEKSANFLKKGILGALCFVIQYPGVQSGRFRLNFILRQLGFSNSFLYKMMFKLLRAARSISLR